MATLKQIIDRIDDVLKQNKRIEWTYIFLTAVLFMAGIACLIVALVSGKFGWSLPPVFTTGFLYWPLKEIKYIRQKNIALATTPMLITKLPEEKATEEIQKLIQKLHESDK